MATGSSHVIISKGAAGSTYNSIEESGENILKVFCNDFPNTRESLILPHLFHAHYPEGHASGTSNIQRNKRKLTQNEENRFIGMCTNQTGERGEYTVYRALHKLTKQTQQQHPFLALRNFMLDCDNASNIKQQALEAELKTILSHVNMRGEHDLIICVKDLGIVFGEVKTSIAVNNLASAENQLDNGESFVGSLLNAIVGRSTFPCVKMIVVPTELSASPTSRTPTGYHKIHKDKLDDFENTWKDILHELRTSTNIISNNELNRLTKFITGIWSMKPIKNAFKFDSTDASLPHQVQETDTRVRCAHLSFDQRPLASNKRKRTRQELEKLNPITDVERCKQTESFQTAVEINLVYVTPEQKDVFDHYKQVMISGSAGTGKSLLLYFKVIEIMKNDPNQCVLLIAPAPHNIRCEKILSANQVDVRQSTTFPPSPASGVVIMTTQSFFGVSKQELLAYNLLSYNLFFDDIQSIQCYRPTSTKKTTRVNYEDIANLFENTYKSSRFNNLYLWILMDIFQSAYLATNTYVNAASLLHISNIGKLSIPTYTLEKILRNSIEITECITEARNNRISKKKVSKGLIQLAYAGHNIASSPVTYHKFVSGRKLEIQFICDRVSEELQHLFTQHDPLKHSQVSILDVFLSVADERILKKELLFRNNITTQTIAEQLTSSNDDHVILDSVVNAMSHENVCVIMIHRSSVQLADGEYYNVITRARSRLIVIDTHDTDPPRINSSVDLITWREQNGTIIKV